jgi:hypothetical protein
MLCQYDLPLLTGRFQSHHNATKKCDKSKLSRFSPAEVAHHHPDLKICVSLRSSLRMAHLKPRLWKRPAAFNWKGTKISKEVEQILDRSHKRLG